jgi:CHRD domain/Prealbumin-like fold domain
MRATRLCAIVVLLLILSAMPAAAQTFIFDLRGSQEVPPVPSTATGGCVIDLNQMTATASITCVHNVVGATLMHIHKAPAGANGPIVFDLGDPASPVTATWSGMSPTDISDMLAGGLYINIHTAGRPAGEIRGQILTRTVDTVAFTADGSQTVPPNSSPSTANCTADLSNDASSLAVNCTHNFPSPVSAHIHEAPAGQTGPIVFTFPSPNSPLSANVPMTPQLIADFAAVFLYLDIHGPAPSDDTSSAEIRGQIGTPPAPPTTGTIQIVKATFPAGGTGFNFTDNVAAPGTFTLDHGQTKTFSAVSPGTYTISENATSGYTLADLSCDDADSTGDTAARTATVRLQAGETVTCTFRNLETSPADTLFVFHLSGDQEVPPVVTPERGGCMGRFDSVAKELTLVCTHDVANPTLMHIHQGAPGVNGPIVFDLGSPVSPVIATWSAMTPAQTADLLAGNYYLNIHTAGRPAGAIRGQIVQRSVDTINFAMDSAQVVPPGTSPATGNCTADLSNDATTLAVSCTHNLPSPDTAHLHRAPRGFNGPILFTFPSAASPFGASVPVTPRDVADFAAYFLYVDVHAASGGDEAGDQIRGQIGVPPVLPTTGTIIIRKATTPAGGGGFNFTDDVPGSGGSFMLNDGGSRTFSAVAPGTYTITEALPGGYSLTNVSCGDGDSTGNVVARTATVRLEAGETVSCTFENLQSVSPTSIFVFHLSGDQEAPPVATTARGGCFAQFDNATSRLAIVCTHNVTEPTLMHIHKGAPGVNGPIVFDLGDPESPVSAVWNMTPADVTDLFAGDLYVNVHSGGRPGGEIRGQILPRTVDQFNFPANGAQEVPPTDSPAVGSCSANLADNAQSVFVSCNHNVAGPTSIHLHDGPPGADGPVIFDFPLAQQFSGDAPLGTPRLIADFAAGFLYINIHSPNYPDGEIRGQLIAGPVVEPTPIPLFDHWVALLLAMALVSVAVWRMR